MEINKLHPIVHATLRVINKETTLTSGKSPIKLTPGMLIYFSYLHLHTSKDLWGPDADEFVPERFIDGRSKHQRFMSFRYGPRNCASLLRAVVQRRYTNIARLDINSPLSRLRCTFVTLLSTYQLDVRDHHHEMKLDTLLETTKPVAVEVTCRS